jgi:hypothetical protein
VEEDDEEELRMLGAVYDNMFVVEISAIGAEILRREIGTFEGRFAVVDALAGNAGVGVESTYLFRRAVNARAISIVIW